MPTRRDSNLTTLRHAPAAPAAPGSHYLLVIADGVVSTHLLPESGTITIGRAQECEVRIDDPSISRKHARLHLGPPLALEDLGSSNGTRVRDEALAARQPLSIAFGEALELGSTMVLVQQSAPPMAPRRLWAHGYFEGRLEDECARAGRSGASFALVRLHCHRDTPTAHVQEVLADAVRADDVVGAYGPGEYELLLMETAPSEAERVAADLSSELERRGVRTRVGLAAYPRDGKSPHALVARACAGARGETRPAGARGAVAVVAADGAMVSLYKLVERIAAGTISVLVMGETGAGKEALAEAVHRFSPRSGKPFLRLNCAALSETLLESELFGHEKGAFTGAAAAKPGLLETAPGGTVFLDEVGELSLLLQTKLLRVLEERVVLRVGSLTPRAIDVRFVAATNRDLEAEVARGAFRQDLFFRLNGISLVVPPLRQRVAEIEPLALAFVEESSRALGRAAPALSPEALAVLKAYSWPGNIRELKNVMERAVLLCDGRALTAEHLPVEKMVATFATRPAPAPGGPALALPQSPPAPAAPRAIGDGTAPPARAKHVPRFDDPTDPGDDATGAGNLRNQVEAIELQHITDALKRCGGNQTEAAKILGMSRRTLSSRLDAYGISRPRKGQKGGSDRGDG
ncbi:MAG TPA: sigma 54-interacting transcriptional regulator [Myxococcota bacterium]|jgi:DNA-binding NtrC family response regulator|nr:sigma 54-interacting transcriptional regulator [Myxococcota bacterium]